MYGTIEIIKALEDAHIHAYLPIAERGQRTGYYGSALFTYDAVHDQLYCPQGQVLRAAYPMEATQQMQYRADAATCNACPVKHECTESNRGRHVHRSFFADSLDRVKAYEPGFAYQKALNKRKVWVEPLFGRGKQWHGMRRFRLRRLWRVNCEALVIASGQNLKRMGQTSFSDRSGGTGASSPIADRATARTQQAKHSHKKDRSGLDDHMQSGRGAIAFFSQSFYPLRMPQ